MDTWIVRSVVLFLMAALCDIAGDYFVWLWLRDGVHPDRYDVIGAMIALAGVAVIMYAPRA